MADIKNLNAMALDDDALEKAAGGAATPDIVEVPAGGGKKPGGKPGGKKPGSNPNQNNENV